jgi:hypothetical protein
MKAQNLPLFGASTDGFPGNSDEFGKLGRREHLSFG